MSNLISLSPKQAFELLENDHSAIFVDIRSSMEYLFVGHPVGTTHIAWIDEPDWDINPNFISDVTQHIDNKNNTKGKNTSIVLICRSGKRTQEAAKALLEAGFTKVIHIDEGFEGERDDSYHRSTIGGWRYHGLPWEQC